jgi:hypothetical protein
MLCSRTGLPDIENGINEQEEPKQGFAGVDHPSFET